LDETELETIPGVRVGEPRNNCFRRDPASTDQAPAPLTIPAGQPCAGQIIAALKPAQLRMLLSKVDQLSAEQGRAWQPLLEALATERATRLQAGQRPKRITVEGNGHDP